MYKNKSRSGSHNLIRIFAFKKTEPMTIYNQFKKIVFLCTDTCNSLLHVLTSSRSIHSNLGPIFHCSFTFCRFTRRLFVSLACPRLSCFFFLFFSFVRVCVTGGDPYSSSSSSSSSASASQVSHWLTWNSALPLPGYMSVTSSL